jgi:glucose/arabinose dehydrogenase
MRHSLLFALLLLAAASERAQAMTAEAWRQALAERIKVPAGYAFSIFAEGLGRVRLMQMTGTGDLLVSAARDGTILLVRGDGDGDGKSDGQRILAGGLDKPHGLLLEGNRLFVAEEHRVTAYQFDGAKLAGGRPILEGIPAGAGHATRTIKRGPDGFLYLSRSDRAAILASRITPGAPPSSASARRSRRSSSPADCATRWASTGGRRRANSMASTMAATIWATMCPTTR